MVLDESERTYMGFDRWLPSAPKVEKPRSVFNAASLAYIGDCIYEVRFSIIHSSILVWDLILSTVKKKRFSEVIFHCLLKFLVW